MGIGYLSRCYNMKAKVLKMGYILWIIFLILHIGLRYVSCIERYINKR